MLYFLGIESRKNILDLSFLQPHQKVKNDSEIQATDRLFIPGWLLELYEKSRLTKESYIWPQGEFSFFPDLVCSEIEALIHFFEPIQNEILLGKSQFDLPLAGLMNRVPYSAKITKEIVARLMQMLRGLAIVQIRSEKGHGNDLSFFSFFENATWKSIQGSLTSKNEKISHVFSVERLSEDQKDILTGYTTSFRRIYREVFAAKETPQISRSIWNTAPLSVCKHIWGDLNSNEKTFLLECEKATQLKSQWLSIDGHFFISTANLNLTHPFSSATTAVSRESTMTSSAMIRKITKKLTDHGYLEPDREKNPLALSSVRNQDFPILILKQYLERSFLSSDMRYLNQYLNGVSRKFFLNQGIKFLEKIYKTQSGKINTEKLMSISEVSEKSLVFTPAIGLIDTFEVFVELKFFLFENARSLNLNFPITDSVRWLENLIHSCELSEIGYKTFQDTFVTNFEDMIANLNEEPTFLGVCLLNQQSKFFIKIQEAVHSGNYASNTTPFESTEDVKKEDSVKSEIVQQKNAFQASSYSLRQVASDELDRLRSGSRGQYLKVVDAYLSSLSESRQRVVSELRKTLSQEAFEIHIKQGLVRYMIENPNSWSSNAPAESSNYKSSPEKWNRQSLY